MSIPLSLSVALDQVYYAYFAPYSYERHCDLVAKCVSSPIATVKSIGTMPFPDPKP